MWALSFIVVKTAIVVLTTMNDSGEGPLASRSQGRNEQDRAGLEQDLPSEIFGSGPD